MTLLLRVAGVSLLGLAVVACRTEADDEFELQGLWREYSQTMQEGDAERMAGLFSSACDFSEASVADLLADLTPAKPRSPYDSSRLAIRNLTEDAAEGMIIWNGRLPGGGSGTVSGNSFSLAKEDGKWKFAECDLRAPTQ